MKFEEFLEVAVERKIEFKYKGEYYHFIRTKSYEENGVGFFIVMFHGKLMYWEYDNWDEKYSIEESTRDYLEFLKNVKIDNFDLKDVINNQLYDKNTLRIIPKVIKKGAFDRNINTIAEMLALNYMNLDDAIIYKNMSIIASGEYSKMVRGSNDIVDYEDFSHLYLCIAPLGHDHYFGNIFYYYLELSKKIIQKKSENRKLEIIDSVDIKDKDEFYEQSLDSYVIVESESLRKFYTYLYEMKIDGILLSDIVVQGLYDYVEMAI